MQYTQTTLIGTLLQVILFVFACIVAVVWNVSIASAATVYVAPSTGTYEVGDVISVGIYVSSADQAINAASVSLSFPQSILTVSSLTRSGSVINLWAAEPSYSNSIGSISLEGIILNPGYTGGSGKIATVAFIAKAEGQAIFSVASGSVLANDGLGTETYTGGGRSVFTIQASAAEPAREEPVIAPPVAEMPVVPEQPAATDSVEAEPGVAEEDVPTLSVPVEGDVPSSILEAESKKNILYGHIAVIAIPLLLLLLFCLIYARRKRKMTGANAWPNGTYLPHATAAVPKLFKGLHDDLFATTAGRLDPEHVREVLDELNELQATVTGELAKAQFALRAMLKGPGKAQNGKNQKKV